MKICTYKDLLQHKFEYNQGIPKIIFRTGRFDISELPLDVKEIYHNEVKENKDYYLFYFDDKDCLEYIKNTKNERIIKAYEKIIPSAYKADLWRYVILNEYGGLYADFSMSFLTKYDSIIKNYEAIFVKDYEDYGLYNAFFAVKKGNCLIKNTIDKVLSNIEKEHYGETALDITGPTTLGKCYKEMNNIKNGELIKNGEDLNNYFIYEHLDNSYVINKETKEKIIKTRIENHYSVLYKEGMIDTGLELVPATRYSVYWHRQMVYKNERYTEIEKIYKDLLNREPDANGIYHYYSSELTFDEIKEYIKDSEEYKNINKI